MEYVQYHNSELIEINKALASPIITMENRVMLILKKLALNGYMAEVYFQGE